MRGTFNLASVPLIISFSIASLFLKGKKIEILTKGLNISIYSLFTCYHADSYLIMKILPVLLVAFILLILVTLQADAEVVTVESKWPTVIYWVNRHLLVKRVNAGANVQTRATAAQTRTDSSVMMMMMAKRTKAFAAMEVDHPLTHISIIQMVVVLDHHTN